MPRTPDLKSTYPRRARSCWLAGAWLATLPALAWTQALPVSKGEPIPVARPFATLETKDTTPRGMSGLACLPPVKGMRSCLAVNDEERFAEWASFDGKTLAPTGQRLQLLTPAKKQKDDIVGTRPRGLCDQEDDFGEFDGEAVAIAGDRIYVTSSHACSRAKGKFRPSSFILARALATAKPLEAKDVERSWRLADIIGNSVLSDAFGKAGDEGAGIEGMALVGNRLYLGFRTPSSNANTAKILSVEVTELFKPGDQPATAKPEVLTLALGPNTGIRDLAALDDGRLLVLSGPADSAAGAYLLHLLTPANGKSRPLVELQTDATGEKKDRGGREIPKAEAIAVLEQTKDAVTLLVMYDNIDDGGPRLHHLALPAD
ncbi:MAG: DUF3616 domain-containing protein [Chromatiaceae bacterium]|nr:DUF3616 domain-containing protein [Chromatiaceae bacterium]